MVKAFWRRQSTTLHLVFFPFFIFLPIPHGSSIPLKRRPVVTMALVWMNIAVFLVTRHSGYFEDILFEYGFVPAQARFLTLFSY